MFIQWSYIWIEDLRYGTLCTRDSQIYCQRLEEEEEEEEEEKKKEKKEEEEEKEEEELLRSIMLPLISDAECASTLLVTIWIFPALSSLRISWDTSHYMRFTNNKIPDTTHLLALRCNMITTLIQIIALKDTLLRLYFNDDWMKHSFKSTSCNSTFQHQQYKQSIKSFTLITDQSIKSYWLDSALNGLGNPFQVDFQMTIMTVIQNSSDV